MRILIHLKCSECGRKNYTTTKNKTTHPDKATYKKYCPFCRKHTTHKESK